MPLSLFLFDDERAQSWQPFSLTRPVAELLHGARTMRERWEHVLANRCSGLLASEHLERFEEAGAPAVYSLSAPPVEGDRLFLSSRALPSWGADFTPGGTGPVRMAGQTIGWWAPAGSPSPSRSFFLDPSTADGPTTGDPVEVPGRVLSHVWELVTTNARQISRDLEALFPSPGRPALPDGVHHVGEHALIVEDDARIEPGVVIDTSAGPVYLGRDVVVRALTRLAGPAYVGPGCTILGGSLEAISLGPVCKVRGELAESVCLGYVNKAHDGHMGHAYLGRWVNLGAETTNSDLKNNYGTIRLWTPAGDVDTGEMKLGCLLGDHVKTGIGLLLNTGTVVGAGSNLFGAAMPPKHVPPFSWGTGEDLVAYRLDKFVEVAERAMARRDVELTDGLREVLRAAWERGRATVDS